EAILDVLEVVAGPQISAGHQHPLFLEVRVAWERLERSSIAAFSVALAQVGEDQPEILLGGVALDLDFAGEGGVLGRLLDALARAVVLPAVVEAANAVPLDPAGAELRPPVRAAGRYQVGVAALIAIERVVLTHDPDRFGVTGGEIGCHVDWLPEAPQVAPRQGAGASMHEVGVAFGGVTDGSLL